MPEIAAFACAVTPQRAFRSGSQQAIDLAHQVFQVKRL